jgi:hypothetical protein
MKDKMKYCALVAVVAALAGCGGGGTDAAVTSNPPSYADLTTSAQAAAAGLIDLDTGAFAGTERTTLPNSGAATYTGYVGGDVNGAGLIGELSLTADFATSGVTGSATNFQHETAGAYTGTLGLQGGTILAGAQFGDPDKLYGTLQGDLVNGGTTYASDIALDGSFLGGTGTDVPDAIAGLADGTIGGDFLTGAFIVKK